MDGMGIKMICCQGCEEGVVLQGDTSAFCKTLANPTLEDYDSWDGGLDFFKSTLIKVLKCFSSPIPASSPLSKGRGEKNG